MKRCERCGQATGSDYADFCNTCNDAVYGNPKREREIAKRIELLFLIHKATTLMTNNELESNLYFIK